MVVFTDDQLTNNVKAPTDPSWVRADCIIGGWHLEPSDGGRRTKATFMLEIDMKGIPQWLIKQANKEQGYQIKELRPIVAKYLDDHPEHK
jgi:hypothetical protein